MQVEEIVRSAFSCMESVGVDDPRCLKAVQEVYAVVSALHANEIRRLSLEPSLLTQDGHLIPSAALAVTSGAATTSVPNTAAGTVATSAGGAGTPTAASSRSASSPLPAAATAAAAAAVAPSSSSSKRGSSAGLPPTASAAAAAPSFLSATATAAALPPHLQSFAVDVLPPLSVKSLILLTARCYSGVAGVSDPSPIVEHVAQVALVILRLCVTADAVLEPSEVQLLGEMALQLGSGRTSTTTTTRSTAATAGTAAYSNSSNHPQARRGSSLSKSHLVHSNEHSLEDTVAAAAAAATATAIDTAPVISSVSVLAAIELLLVSLYNGYIGGLTADAALGAASRHWLSAWLLRVEDGSAQPIEIFHRLCCFQRIVTLRPLPASSVFAAQTTHERLIRFVCGEGGAVHASSVGLALHLLAQIVENGPENMMLAFVTPRLIEFYIASWAASEWTETLEGAFVLLTAVVRLGLSPELWCSIVRSNLHLACAHAIASPSVRVAASAASCLRTMLFLCQRELDIGLSVFFDAQAAPHILRILNNGPENIAAAAAASKSRHHHHHHHHHHHQSSSHVNQSFDGSTPQQIQQHSATTDIVGLRILNTECALAVAVFASFSPAHRVAIHHCGSKYGFALAMQRAHLALTDADLSLFVNWSLFDEHGRSADPLQDPQFAALLSARPLSSPPPGISHDEWRDAAFVKLSLIKSLQNPSDADVASVVGLDTHPRPLVGSKELSLALLRHFSTQLQRIAATEGKGGAFPFSEAHHHANLSSSAQQQRQQNMLSNNNNNNNRSHDPHNDSSTSSDPLSTSNINEAALAQGQFESCVNLILRFAKCAPLPKRETLTVSRQPAGAGGRTRRVAAAQYLPRHQHNDSATWQPPPGTLITERQSAIASHGMLQQQQVVLLTRQTPTAAAAGAGVNNRNKQQQHVQSFSAGDPRAGPVYNVSSSAADAVAARHHAAPSALQHMRSASENSANYLTVNHSGDGRRGAATGARSTVASSSRPHNETGFRRTHLFSHPYVDYYLNAQHRNGFTPNPVVPPQVRRWSLEDVQRGDLFNFFIRLDGLEDLVEEHERQMQEMLVLGAEGGAAGNYQRNDALDLHREGDEEDQDEEEYAEEEEDAKDEGDVERFQQPPLQKVPSRAPSSSRNTDFSVDDPPEVQQQLSFPDPAARSATATTSNRTPSVIPPSGAVAVVGSAASNNNNNHNDNRNKQRSSSSVDPASLPPTPLQQRVTALVADALHSAETHLLALNEKAQCCPTKMVHRRAFLVDMINNVMPAIVSMMTMLFSVAKRAPAAIVRVTKRVERSAVGGGGGRGDQQNQQCSFGAIAIHGGNICAVCHGLEMELLWS